MAMTRWMSWEGGVDLVAVTAPGLEMQKKIIQRSPLTTAPFVQQGLEAPAAAATLKVDGREVEILIPPVGITGGPCAVSAPCGLYAR